MLGCWCFHQTLTWTLTWHGLLRSLWHAYIYTKSFCIYIYYTYIHTYLQGTSVHGLIWRTFVRACAELDSGEVFRRLQRLACKGHTSVLWPLERAWHSRERPCSAPLSLCVHYVPEEPLPQKLKDESIFHWCMKGGGSEPGQLMNGMA